MSRTKKWKKYEHKHGLGKRILDEEMNKDIANDTRELEKDGSMGY